MNSAIDIWHSSSSWTWLERRIPCMLQLPPWIRADSCAGPREQELPWRVWYEGMTLIISIGSAFFMVVNR